MPAATKDQCLWMFRTMVLIRRFEEQAKREQDSGRIRSTHSAIGQEAVPTGICANLRNDDYLLGNHRSHHHGIAKGLDPKEMMAELLGKVTGTNRGKGGSMHVADVDKGILGANGIVAGGPPISVGAALAAKIRKNGKVAISFSGDGSVNQGTCFEAMNLAVVLEVPAVFVIENNYYSEHTNISYAVGCDDLKARTESFGFPVFVADGADFFSVYEAAGKAIEHALDGLGFDGVGEVRQGKVIELELDTADKDAALSQVSDMCEKLLANTVIEDYSIDLAD